MQPIKLNHVVLVLALLAFFVSNIVAAPIGTAFTYQGRLASGTDAVSGLCNISFGLYDAETNGAQVGLTLVKWAVPVTNGLFVVSLDFGNVFAGNATWLSISVMPPGTSTWTLLSPRQPLTPAPYAMTAGNLTGALPAGQLAGTYSNAVTLNNAGNSFTGNGSGLVDLNPAAIVWGSCPPWSLCGNAGTTPGVNFLGTTDSQDLWLKVNNQVGWRLLRSTSSASEPNIAGGGLGNRITSGAKGSGIAAGNSNAIPNSVYYASIGGGWSNQLMYVSPYGYGDYGVIGGGQFNVGAGLASVIGGGALNTNYGDYATIPGGEANSAIGGHAVIGGGSKNKIPTGADYSTIGGGAYNSATGDNATVGGGYANTASDDATVGGGYANTAGDARATVGGGIMNGALGLASTVSGGDSNRATNLWGTISGGRYNQNGGQSATIGGGEYNTISSNAFDSTISGGYQNTVSTGAQFCAIAGGKSNQVAAGYGVVAGGANNVVTNEWSWWGVNGQYASVGGGAANYVSGSFATIAGGASNRIDNLADPSVDPWSSDYATIGGGLGNRVAQPAGTIAGGRWNLIQEPKGNDQACTIGGGSRNQILKGNNVDGPTKFSTISGGESNTVFGVAPYAVIAGGGGNFVNNFASTAPSAGALRIDWCQTWCSLCDHQRRKTKSYLCAWNFP